MNSNVQTVSGNRVVVEFDGKVVGLCQTIKPTDAYGLLDAVGIGDIHVVEHVPAKAVHTIVVQTMILMKSHLRNAGISPQNGDDVLRGQVFDIVLYSKDTGEMMRKYIGCSYDTGGITVEANKISLHDATFKALDVVGTGV